MNDIHDRVELHIGQQLYLESIVMNFLEDLEGVVFRYALASSQLLSATLS